MRSVATTPLRLSTGLAANEARTAPAERRAALQRMSGVLTHDLNNLLGVILGASERLAAELDPGSEQQKLALIAIEAAERGGDLIRRAATLGGALGRDPAPAALAVDCAAAIAAARRMARQAISPGVRLRATLPPPELRCLADRTGLEMALLNLCLNAGQATPAGGGVFVSARETQIGDFDARRLGLAPGAYAGFTVRDTGVGMSPETLSRACEPLFTTKATGSGLGLSSVRDFAAAMGGALSLRSREGHGVTATLYVPVTDAAHEAAI